jgi:hypothetical protein
MRAGSKAMSESPPTDKNDQDLPGMLAVAKGIAEQRWPHTMDAQVWAREFNKTHKELHGFSHDEDWLIGWFANAIMAGYDTAQARASSPERAPNARMGECIGPKAKSEIELLVEASAPASSELERLREFQLKTEEAEARCCPEDVGFEEWIGVLSKRRESAPSSVLRTNCDLCCKPRSEQPCGATHCPGNRMPREEVIETARELFGFYGWTNERDQQMRRRVEIMRNMALALLDAPDSASGWRKCIPDMQARPETGYVLSKSIKYIVVFDGNEPWEFELPPLPVARAEGRAP